MSNIINISYAGRNILWSVCLLPVTSTIHVVHHYLFIYIYLSYKLVRLSFHFTANGDERVLEGILLWIWIIMTVYESHAVGGNFYEEVVTYLRIISSRPTSSRARLRRKIEFLRLWKIATSRVIYCTRLPAKMMNVIRNYREFVRIPLTNTRTS